MLATISPCPEPAYTSSVLLFGGGGLVGQTGSLSSKGWRARKEQTSYRLASFRSTTPSPYSVWREYCQGSQPPVSRATREEDALVRKPHREIQRSNVPRHLVQDPRIVRRLSKVSIGEPQPTRISSSSDRRREQGELTTLPIPFTKTGAVFLRRPRAVSISIRVTFPSSPLHATSAAAAAAQ